ncbi:hypothetical protein [Thermoanaerobacterium thermosulfurigenes]|uniref:hypothetical protein n=1 Tax=Thermoanaerobacterium thermosulfurigenes TaxID=33950 RepID=UPI003EFB192B
MKYGIRKPSLKKSIAARTSVKRFIRHNLGIKAPRGYGWLTNPKKAAYNRIYNRTIYECRIIPKCSIYIRENIYRGVFTNEKEKYY